MQTKPKPKDLTGLFLAFALLASITVPLPAGVAKAMDEVRHAIGWDRPELKAFEAVAPQAAAGIKDPALAGSNR
jgi:hypothetical protein